MRDCLTCIRDTQSGDLKPTPPNAERFIAFNWEKLRYYHSGKSDTTFTLKQRAHQIQTGETVPFLILSAQKPASEEKSLQPVSEPTI